jgi:hypothetical protein
VSVVRRDCEDVIKDAPFLGNRSILHPPPFPPDDQSTRCMVQRADVVCVDAKVVPEKMLTFDCNMDTTSVNQPFDLLSDIEAREYFRMCSDDNCGCYESMCRTPECLRNDQTTYENLLNDAAIDVLCDALMRLTLIQLCSGSKFSIYSGWRSSRNVKYDWERLPASPDLHAVTPNFCQCPQSRLFHVQAVKSSALVPRAGLSQCAR